MRRQKTNGDVVKALNPLVEIKYLEDSVLVYGKGVYQSYKLDWWTAPYGSKL